MLMLRESFQGCKILGDTLSVPGVIWLRTFVECYTRLLELWRLEQRNMLGVKVPRPFPQVM
jgi:hypothetical protein